MTRLNIWGLFTILLTGLMYMMFEAGIYHMMWEVDTTKLSFIISGILLYHVGKLGWLLRSSITITEKHLDAGFEASELVMTLGMIGTVVGFIMMLTSFVGVDFNNIENVSQLFGLATKGMSTALYTTLVGLIAHVILRCSYFVLEQSEK